MIKRKVGFNFGYSVNCEGRKMGLEIMWRFEIELRIKRYCKHFIDTYIKYDDEDKV